MQPVRAIAVSDDAPWAVVAEIVDRFEDALQKSSGVELTSFLPDPADPLYARVAVELVRVDLEHHWSLDHRRRLQDYRLIAPKLFESPELLADAAFEEYRLRRLSGEEADPQEYADHFGISTIAWPRIQASVACPSSLHSARSSASMPEPGDEFACFRLIRVLGRGAFATVFLSEQNDLARRPVVLKISQRRTLEPQHLARLQHTNIVPVYSVHEQDGLTAVCMPYCGDQTLADRIGRRHSQCDLQSTVAKAKDETVRGALKEIEQQHETTERSDSPRRRLALNESVRLVRDLADGLAHAHKRGIIHRDLKPANVLLADDGRPMLLDFNLADGALAGDEASLTVGGTLPYMAPEHLDAVRSGAAVDARCDLFALGVILFELLTGRRPYVDWRGEFDTVIARGADERRKGAPSPKRYDAAIPASVDALVKKCLAPDPEDRYSSAAALREDLTRHLQDLPLRHAANPSLSERVGKWRRRHPRLASGGSVGAICALAVVMLLSLLVTRASHLARLESIAQFEQFREDASLARSFLSVPNIDRELLREGLELGRNAIGVYVTLDSVDDSPTSQFGRLDSSQTRVASSEIGELAYLMAQAETVLAATAPNDDDAARDRERALVLNRLSASLLGSFPTLDGQGGAATSEKGLSAPKTAGHANSQSSGVVGDRLQAQLLLDEHRFIEAIGLLRSLRDKHPDDPAIWLMLGNAFGACNELADAEASLSVAAALQPESYVPLYNRGLCRMQRGKFEAAATDFASVVEARPTLLCARLNRALALESLGQRNEALSELDVVIATGLAPPRAYLVRSGIRLKSGDAAGARSDLEQGIALVPIDEVGWVARGVAKLPSDPQGALADFQEAYRRYPMSVNALKNIVHVTSDRLGSNEAARRALDDWLRLEPESPDARIGRAVLAARQGSRKQAMADLDIALAASRRPATLFQAACALSLTGVEQGADYNRGLLLLGEAVAADPALRIRATLDPDLANLRKTDGYQKLMAAYLGLAKAKDFVSQKNAARQPEEEN